MESSMATQRTDLESHLRTTQAGLEDKSQELNKAQEQLQKVTLFFFHIFFTPHNTHNGLTCWHFAQLVERWHVKPEVVF